MQLPDYTTLQIPDAPKSIQKGSALKDVLDDTAIAYLARNITLVDSSFDATRFMQLANHQLDALSLMDRGRHIAKALQQTLPPVYGEALAILLATFTPAKTDTSDSGLAGFFYLPHSCFIGEYGLSADDNHGEDPFEISMAAQYALTQRFTAEFSIRPFLIARQTDTLDMLHIWLSDDSPHVRRLCSEGTRPKLPWGLRLKAFIEDPTPLLPILEALKNDDSLYVQRSVANHLGDIAKDHPDWVFDICEQWVEGADKSLKWLIRHAVRYHAKKEHPRALALRQAAK